METTFIYFLKDPENPNKGYVGKTGNLKKRLSDHFTECRDKKHHRANWLKALAARNLKPTLEVVDEVPFEHWKQLEVAYIEFFLEQGYELTNGTPGGEDPPLAQMLGKHHSIATRAKIGAANKGRKFTPESCAKISAAQLGRKLSPEHRAKLRAAHTGKVRSPEHQAKLNAAATGKKFSPERCAAMSIALKGKKLPPEFNRSGKKPSTETRSKMSDAQKRRRDLEKIFRQNK